MKTHTTHSLALLAVLLVSCSAFAQERIRELTEVKSENSIIRNVDEQRRLVFNEGYDYPYFIMLDNGDVDAVAMRLPEGFTVLDFTIHQETVYFCGYFVAPATTDTVATVGWFPLEGFPSSEVRHTKHFSFKQFTKIGVYIVSSEIYEPHLVLIAKCQDDSYTLLDAYFHTDDFNLMQVIYHQSIRPGFQGHRLDDLIVTDNYVVVSSREQTSSPFEDGILGSSADDRNMPVVYWKGHLWCFTKPNSPGYSIFSIMPRNCLLGTMKGKVLLESLGITHLYFNDYVALFSEGFVGSGTPYIVRFNGYIYKARHKFGTPGKHYGFREARYNPDCRRLSVRLWESPIVFPYPDHNHFYHIDMSNLYHGGTVYGHRVINDAVYSFTHVSDGNRFEAVGHPGGAGDAFRTYTYEFNSWRGCFLQAGTEITYSGEKYTYKDVDDFYGDYAGWTRHSRLTTVSRRFRVDINCEN